MWTILEAFRGYFRKSEHTLRNLYRVQCGCGVIEIRRKDHVDSGRTKYCNKCAAINTYRVHGHNNPILGKKNIHKGIGTLSRSIYLHYKYGADKRQILFEVTIENIWEIFVKQNGLCALSGVPIILESRIKNGAVDYSVFTASLDRIDSKLGYVVGNVQWVHRLVNKMKQDIPEETFLKWCSIIHANHELSQAGTPGKCND